MPRRRRRRASPLRSPSFSSNRDLGLGFPVPETPKPDKPGLTACGAARSVAKHEEEAAALQHERDVAVAGEPLKRQMALQLRLSPHVCPSNGPSFVSAL